MKTRTRLARLTNGDACCLPPAGTVRVTPRGFNHVYNPILLMRRVSARVVIEKPSIKLAHTYVFARTTATTKGVLE